MRTTLVDETDTSFKEAGVNVRAPRVDASVWLGTVKAIVPLFSRRAALVAYVCRRCGLTELYTPGCADLPVGPQYGAELVDVAPVQGPYR